MYGLYSVSNLKTVYSQQPCHFDMSEPSNLRTSEVYYSLSGLFALETGLALNVLATLSGCARLRLPSWHLSCEIVREASAKSGIIY